MFHESLKKQFNVKLVFHEILWKKNLTVYPSLKIYSFVLIKSIRLI